MLYARMFFPDLYHEDKSEEKCIVFKASVQKSASVLSVLWNESYHNDSLFAIGGEECQLSLFKVDEQRSAIVNVYKAAKVLFFLTCRKNITN